MVLAWVFFSNRALRPAPLAPLPDVVEINFEVPEAVVAIPAAAEARAGMPLHGAPRALALQRRDVISNRDAKIASAGFVEGSAQGSAAQAPGAPSNASAGSSAGAPPNGEGDRLATFQPAHPNLHGPMRFPAPEEKPRDLLAQPTAKKGISSSELPKVIQGVGGVTASVAEDGTIRFQDPHAIVMDPQRFSGHLDVTDQVMKLAGQDPYASTKRTLANETREQRLCMAKRYQGERQKQELFTLSTKVRHLAASVDLSAAQRRELVFAIWDECLEESDSATDYGALARATILSVVREAFPVGSDRAYQPTELLAFNQRRSSRQRFAPYDPSPMTRARQPDSGVPAECSGRGM